MLDGEDSCLSPNIISPTTVSLFDEDSVCTDPKEIVANDERFEISVERFSSEERTSFNCNCTGR